MWYLIVSIPDLCTITYFDEDDALKYAIKKRRYLLDGKLEEFDPPTYSLGEDDESDSLQQSSGSKYAPSQLQ